MARDERRRQKSLARKKAKKQARHHAQQSRTSAFQNLFDGVSKSAIRQAPIHECWCGNTFQDQGIGHVIISRQLPTGCIAAAAFLVDTFCLGAKDGFLKVLDKHEFEDFKTRVFGRTPGRLVAPPYARKFIEDAVAYARQFGFEPPRDYHTAAVILGDIDPSKCAEKFVFGKDGKPFYIRGPSETAIRADQIVKQLIQRCGPDGFKFIVGGPLGDFDEDDAGFDDDIEDEPDDIENLTQEVLSAEPLPDPASSTPAPPEAKPRGFFGRFFRR